MGTLLRLHAPTHVIVASQVKAGYENTTDTKAADIMTDIFETSGGSVITFNRTASTITVDAYVEEFESTLMSLSRHLKFRYPDYAHMFYLEELGRTWRIGDL